MKKIDRDDIQMISQHSNWSEEGIQDALQQHVYHQKASWIKFLRLFCVGLGVSFLTAGIIFFFAYNWADLHKFIKLGLVEFLIVSSVLVVLLTRLNDLIKNILLAGTSVLVGVLFAVFGQIYQTGANAYDFFLGWTMFIAIWVVISNFAPLWTIFIGLINTTIILYSVQVAHGWSQVFIFTLLFLINTFFLAASIVGKRINSQFKAPIWFTNIVALTAVSFCTIGLVIGIVDEKEVSLYVLLALSAILYGLGIVYGFKVRSGFYLSIIPFSVIVIVSAFMANISQDAGMFLLIGLFVVGCVTLIIKNLINLQKKWTS